MSHTLTADEIITLLGLSPLEGEGGYFRQTWVRPAPPGRTSDAPEATAILYLVTPESFSALHRLPHDELFHFYLGDPCEQVVIHSDGTVEPAMLGPDLRAGMQVQRLVPAGAWQGTRLAPGGRFALLGTTMTPGFDPGGFELATPQDLADLDPSARARGEAFLALQ
jgi:predicted cupin superfamily sugar epimerase